MGIYLEHPTVQEYGKDLGQPKERLLSPEEQMAFQLGDNNREVEVWHVIKDNVQLNIQMILQTETNKVLCLIVQYCLNDRV